MSNPRRFAVVDIGSNATRLLVGLIDEGKFFTEVFTRIPLRLGSGTYGDNQGIRDDAILHLQKTIEGMRLFMEVMHPTAWRVVATAALRDAANRDAVIAAVAQHCAVEIEVLSGQEEAEVIGKYVARQFPDNAVLNIDVGGGSTDCALLENYQLIRTDTFALGTTRPNSGEEAEKTRFLQWMQQAHRDNLIISGSGGSVRALAAMCKVISAPRLASWQRKLTKMQPLQISEKYNLSPDRAENIIAALKIYQLVLQSGGTLHPVAGGLAEAVLRELATDQ